MTKSDTTPVAPIQPNDPKGVEDAIKKGQEILATGGSKADAARAIYELLIDEPREVVLRAFVEGATLRVSKGRLRYLTFEEERQLLKALDPRREVKGLAAYHDRTPELRRQMQDLYDFVILLLDTGARYSELATLEWRRVNLTERSIQLWRSKVRNESILFMTDRAAEVLNRRGREQHGEFVFTNKKGEQRGYSVVGLRKAFKNAGLPDCSAHTLRHTHATRLIQNGLSLYEVKEILGHADIKTTMRYAHIEQRSVSVKAREVINRLNKEQQKPDLRVVA